jgi:hypothetical protein
MAVMKPKNERDKRQRNGHHRLRSPDRHRSGQTDTGKSFQPDHQGKGHLDRSCDTT